MDVRVQIKGEETARTMEAGQAQRLIGRGLATIDPNSAADYEKHLEAVGDSPQDEFGQHDPIARKLAASMGKAGKTVQAEAAN